MGCQVNTHFFLVKYLGISSLQYSLDRSITLEIFSLLFETYSIRFISSPYSQDLESRFNTLQYSFLETKKEVKQLSANVVAINTTMQSSMGKIKQDLTTQLESVCSALCTKLHIPTDNPSSSSPPHIEGDHSSHSHTLKNHHFQRDLHLPWVDVTKFDGLNPTG